MNETYNQILDKIEDEEDRTKISELLDIGIKFPSMRDEIKKKILTIYSHEKQTTLHLR